jgi:hypothetical protein
MSVSDIAVEVDVHLDADNGSPVRGARPRKMTAAGLLYALGMKKKRLRQLAKGIERHMDGILDQIDDAEDQVVVNNSFKKWIGLFDEFLECDVIYRDLQLSEDDIEAHLNWFQPRVETMREFQVKTQLWLDRKGTELNVDHHHDDETIHSASTGSSCSIASAKLKEFTKRAELEVKAQQLKKKAQIQQEKLNLKLHEEEIAIEEAMMISQAKSRMLDSVHKNNDDFMNVQKRDNAVKRDPDSVSEVSAHTSMTASHAVHQMVRKLNMPKVDLQPFCGDPLTFRRFMRQFNTSIANNCVSPEERLNYLEQFTRGQPKDIVAGWLHVDPNIGYTAAVRELQELYGDEDVIVNAFVSKVLAWSSIRADKPSDLSKFSIFLTECENAVSGLDAMGVLNYSENMKRIIGKLPYYLHDRWRNLVYATKEKGERVTFSKLVKFVRAEAKKSSDPTYGREAMTPKDVQKVIKPKARINMNTSTIDKGHSAREKSSRSQEKRVHPGLVSPCMFCHGNHALECCETLQNKQFYERIDILKNNRLCYACLKVGHSRQECKFRAKCHICNGRHPTVLHVDGRIPSRVVISQSLPTVSDQASQHPGSRMNTHLDSNSFHPNACSVTGAGETTMAIIPVKIYSRGKLNTVMTYAFLDPGSNLSFCSTKLMRQLGCEGIRRKLTMNTMGEKYTMYTNELKNLIVCDLGQMYSINLPTMYSKDTIPVSNDQIPCTADLKKWAHLQDIELPQIDADIGLLLGNDVPDAYAPLQVITGPSGTPHVSRTRLGLVAWNIIRPNNTGSTLSRVNRADVIIHDFQCCRELDKSYQKGLALDFPEKSRDEILEPSRDDKLFITKMENSKQMTNGHYEFCLPFKHCTELPANKTQALQRLASLKKKFAAKPKFHSDYTAFMTNIIQKGFAEVVPDDSIDRSGKAWYLPHHGVYHPKKPTKIRVVFDCSAQYHGISLNSMLLSGPDLTNSLIGVLLRFRQDRVAIIGDVECMFYQVNVVKSDRDYLRFFWWPDGNIHRDPVVYRMTVHLFGASSSPSCANYALLQTVADNEEYFDAKVCQAVRRNFYVDDFLCSLPTHDAAIDMIQKISFLCSLGGFHLTKWMSNRRQILETVEEQERASTVKDLTFQEFPANRALGVYWDVQSDSFSFQVHTRDVKPTRRNVLSHVSSIYDPLGLASPFILVAKLILQEACQLGIGWDEEMTNEQRQKWKAWTQDLHNLTRLRIPRCMKPIHCDDIVQVQVHNFSDASENGYGMVSYLRYERNNGDTHCILLLSRSRVTPLKKVTIPRLELTAATLAVRISQMITRELDINVQHIFWTDSMSTLRYIANETSRFRTFVANRVSLIRECTLISQWKYVPSKCNPADLTSRGSTVYNLQQDQWMKGPDFLWAPERTWPESLVATSIPDNDAEIIHSNKVSNACQCESDSPVIDFIISRCSTWSKIKRIVAWVLLAIYKFKRKNVCNQITARCDAKVMTQTLALPDDMLARAEIVLISTIQLQYYEQEIRALKEGKHIQSSSDIYQLDPFLDKDKLLRVGGRLDYASVDYDTKHQYLIPRQNLVAYLLIRDTHKAVGHLGKNSTLMELRKRFWITKAGVLIKSMMSKCVICKRHRASTMKQKMSDLPEDRVQPDINPFSHTGMDDLGPITVKRGRTNIKRYGVLFTCMASRAVHLEVACDLSTDSCICAIRRFVARRGAVQVIRSDNGTNLVGAEREMRQEMQQWNSSKISTALQQNAIKWIFNPPTASHFGGSWERIIRSVRKVLYSLMKEQVIHLDDEGLQTLFCEVENILNSRPLTLVSDSPDDVTAITPNDLLLVKPAASLPIGVFTKDDCYVRRRWRRIQYIASQFWKRWKEQYLHLLQQRQKWQKLERNLSVGDIVLTIDQPRGSWILARVEDVIKDRKGLVRVVTIKTPSGIYQRPIHKLSLILETQ